MFETQLSSDARHRNLLLFIISLVCLFVVGFYVLLWSYICFDSDRLPPVAFDSTQWKDKALYSSEQAIRIRMIDDLLENYKLVGMSRAEIIALLGEPDHILGSKDNAPDIKNDRMEYYLGPDWLDIDSEWLVLRLNEGQQVIELERITT